MALRSLARLRVLAGLAAAWLALAAASCPTVPPGAAPSPDVPSAGKFPHERLDLVLEKVVSADGLVDYRILQLEQASLEEYLAEVARVSPDSHAHLFPNEDERLAYWINAYNACALRGVLFWHRPASLAEIAHRFDSESTYIVGGKRLSLNGISNGIIRRRFPDPRVHFVLVKGRRGGPPLQRASYRSASLDERLTVAARAFVNEERNVEWSPPSTQVRLSRLFFDFRGDFERSVPASAEGDARLIAAVDRWRAPAKKLVATRVVPIPFDERLNDVMNR